MAERNLDIVINARNNADKELRSLGKTLEANKATIQKTAAVSGAAFAGLTAAVTMSVRAYANAGDQIQKMALRTGFSTTALSELKHAAELSGTSIEAIEKAAIKMGKTLLDASDESIMAQRAIERLGFSLDDLENKSPEERFFMLASAIADIEDPSRKSAVAMEIFGKQGVNLLPMLAAGADGIADMREEAHQLGIVFDQEAADAAALFNDNMDRLGKSVDGVKFAVAEAFIPVLTDLLEKVTPVIQRVQEWIKENPELTRNIILAVGAITGLIAVVSTITLMMMAFNPVIGLVVVAIASVMLVVQQLTRFMATFGVTWGDVWNGIKNVTSSIINGIISMIESYINYYVNAINTVIRGINNVISIASRIPGIGKKYSGLQITELSKVEFGRVGQADTNNVNVTVYGDVSGNALMEKVGSGIMGTLMHNVRV